MLGTAVTNGEAFLSVDWRGDDANVQAIAMILGLPMGFLMARRAEGDQILGNVIAQPASRLKVMDLKIHRAPAPVTTPSVSLQDFAAELAISFRVKSQAHSRREAPPYVRPD
jgi:hypothetical protein